MTLQELEKLVDDLGSQITSLESTVTNISVWAGVAGTAIAILAIVVTVVGFFGISEFSKAKSAARLAQAQAEQAIEKMENQSKGVVTEIQKEKEELKNKYEKWSQHSKYFISAEVHYRNSDFQEALHHYEQAMGLWEDENTKYRVARCLTYLGQTDAANQIFDELLDANDRQPEFLRGRAFALRFERPELSIKTLKEAHSLAFAHDPRSILAFKICNDIGLIYRDLARYPDCKEWHAKGLELSPNDGVTLFFAAISYGLNGMKEEFSDTLKVADAAATREANLNNIKPLWRDVIKWSCFADERKQKLSAELWSKMRLEFQAEYVRRTVEANLNCVIDITGVNTNRYKPEPM